MEPHGVVMVNEALDKSSGILLGKRAARPEAISFEALVPAFNFPVTLWVIVSATGKRPSGGGGACRTDQKRLGLQSDAREESQPSAQG